MVAEMVEVSWSRGLKRGKSKGFKNLKKPDSYTHNIVVIANELYVFGDQ
jgi:hypothetical protein